MRTDNKFRQQTKKSSNKLEPKAALGKTRQQSKDNHRYKNKNIAPPIFKKDKQNSDYQQPANIISKTLALLQMCETDLQIKGFDENWQEFIKLSSHLFSFILFIPNPLNDQGRNILKNGKFFILWLKLLSMNPYVNHRLIAQNTYQKYFDDITSHKTQFLDYCESLTPTQSYTPTKVTNQNQIASIKRPILKNSDKKIVQFKQDEIIYPRILYPEQINFEEARKLKKQQLRAKNGYIIDYFEINNVYLLDEVEFVGLIKQIECKYAIVLVRYPRNHDKNRQIACIGLIQSNIQDHNPSVLQQIQKQFQNLCFIDLEGKDPGSLVVDSISTDSTKKMKC